MGAIYNTRQYSPVSAFKLLVVSLVEDSSVHSSVGRYHGTIVEHRGTPFSQYQYRRSHGTIPWYRNTTNTAIPEMNVCQFLPRCMECLRGLATRKLSVRPSVKRVHCDKKEERSLKIFTPYEKPFSLVF